MNKKVLKVLEFEKILSEIASFTLTEPAYLKVKRLIPQKELSIIQNNLQQTSDAANVLRIFGGFPISKLTNIIPMMGRLQKGSLISSIELSQIYLVLRITEDLQEFFVKVSDRELSLPFYDQKLADIELPTDLYRTLKRSVNFDGEILDTASSELTKIRQKITSLENERKKRLEDIIHGSLSKYLSEPIITIRNNRQVILVRAEYKAKFGGIVHDQSATGQTLFIEPQVVLSLNNNLATVKHEEKVEIQRILTNLSENINENRDAILYNARLIYDLDFAEAKAKYAKKNYSTLPIITDNYSVDLIGAFHPFIDHDKVVKNNIKIGENYHQMIITGPNTGGKTITLKTVGLIQIMAQSGLFIPATDGSKVGVFSEIYADIGDEQSIEQNLSTFSSHIKNIVSILDTVDNGSLILFDEIGAGTDPEEGAALSISILDHLRHIGSYVLATTHYPELKLYAYNTNDVINASMEFDLTTLSPTYHLLVGSPGKSFAFAIARRLGISEDIIKNSETLLSSETIGINEMIDNLENDQQALVLEKDKFNQLNSDLDKERSDFEAKKEEYLTQAQNKANEIIAKAEGKAKYLIAELKRSNAAKDNDQRTINKVQSELKNLHEDILAKNKVLKKAKAKKNFSKGDLVLVETYNQTGTLVQKVGSNSWQVQIGSLKMTVPEDQLSASNQVKSKKATKTSQSSRGKVSIKRSSIQPSSTLDLRGKRYEDAEIAIDQFIDSALLANYPSVSIIHGFGTGTIRNLVQEKLRNNPRVEDFNYAPANEGGNGATIVKLR